LLSAIDNLLFERTVADHVANVNALHAIGFEFLLKSVLAQALGSPRTWQIGHCHPVITYRP
jgi:hypothetical protein